MSKLVFAIPGDINLPTGGYAYDRHVLRLLPEHGITPSHLELPGTFPHPTDADVARTAALLNDIDPGMPVLIDGLAYGAIPPTALDSVRAPIIALVHHPLALEAGLEPARARELADIEKANLERASAIIVTSRATGRLLASEFSVDESRITVAEPGTERAQRASGSGGETMNLLTVGSVVPRKGYDVLVEAMAGLHDLNWRLRIVGAVRDEAFAATVRDLIARHGLDDRISLDGALPDDGVASAYAAADIFILSSRFEGFGMVLTEALARGLPIVTTTGGAAAETVPDDAALKVQPDDANALRGAIRTLLADRAERTRRADAAWQAAQSLSTWDDTAARIAARIKDIAS